MQPLACVACGGTDHRVIRAYHSHSSLFNEMELVCCQQCNLVFALPAPTDEQLRLYNESYFDNAHGGLNMHPEALLFFSGIALLRLEHVLSFCKKNSKTPNTVVEIGPGHGYFWEHMQVRLPACQYTAVESDSRCHDRLRELGATICEDISLLEPNAYDLLVMSHVLEHGAKPDEFLRTAMDCLKPGGVIFIEVPCKDHEFKEEDEPHLVFFDKQSMSHLLNRLNIGSTHLSYHGKKIHKIRKQGSFYERIESKWWRIQRRLEGGKRGKPPGIEDLAMWHAIRPYEPHLEHEEPSWWLRAMGCKSS
jgi:SAM-dependent methyltransferase